MQGMTMRQDEHHCIESQRPLDHLARIHRGTVDVAMGFSK